MRGGSGNLSVSTANLAASPPASNHHLGLTVVPARTYQNVHTQSVGLGRGRDEGDNCGPFGFLSGRRMVLTHFGPSSEKPRDNNRDTTIGTRSVAHRTIRSIFYLMACRFLYYTTGLERWWVARSISQK